MKPFTFLLLFTTIGIIAGQTCHYSCATCTGPAYTQCLSCSESGRTVQYGVTCDGSDQAILTLIGGFCGSSAYSRANPLGVVLIFLSVLAGLFLKSQYIFYFILSMQTIGLIGLVETAFPSGLSLFLGSFDYFMLFSIMGQNTKPQNCKLMLRRMYRLNDFLGTTNFKDNSPPILTLVFIATALLILVSLFRAFRKDRCSFLSDNFLDQLKVALRTFLILAVQ